MNSSSVMPPYRIQCELNVECLFFLTTYFVLRALPARRHSAIAQATWTTSESSSTVRAIQRKPSCGSSGSPSSRRWWAYSLNASWPENALRLPYM